ncbi:MAG: cache domain-containing protein, partial [Thermoanaerobacterales bacterium]|nr:cache domain-containing protein [Thermoanaerobacterales bacterium]
MKTGTPDTGRKRTWSLRQIVRFTVGFLIVLTLAVSLGIALYLTRGHMFETSQESLKKDLALSYALIDQQYPGPWAVKDGKLYKGDTVMNENFAVVDNVTSLTGDAVTVFQDDTRVATTVKDEKGNRKVGTKAAPQVVETVLKKGESYLGEADVAGVPHLTAYMPLKDEAGRVIGMWFVGLSLDRVQAAVTSVTWQMSLAGLV